MYDLYFWPTPNGYKVLLFAEEAKLTYSIKPINIGKGEQFDTAFLGISPNNKIPALVDYAPQFSTSPISLFESGAILLYLAEKTLRFIPTDLPGRVEVLQWLFWQMGGLGPMAGQNHHFNHYAPEKIPYAVERYVNETSRLYAVLDKRLSDRPFIAGDSYTIADMAAYPWIVPHARQNQNLDDFPNVKRWFSSIETRPATVRAYQKGKEVNSLPLTLNDKSRKVLFGQSATTVQR